jgi:exosortase
MRVLTPADPPVAETISAPPSADHKVEPRVWLAAGAIAALVVAIYASTFGALAHDWWTDNQGASYGILIPPLVLYIAYARRAQTFSVPASYDARGVAVILLSCALFLMGKLGAEYFITRLSFVTMLAGLSLTFWGAGRTRTLGFPFLLLITMIPLPLLVYNRVTLPLQLFSSESAATIIQFFGGSVYRDGNVLHLANTTLGVAEACSGLHSLASLVVAAVLLGFAECTSLRSRVVLVILAVPLAIAVNVVRVTGTTFLAQVNPDYAEGFYHAFSGWAVFLVGFGLTWIIAKGLHRLLDRGVSLQSSGVALNTRIPV